MSGRGTRAGALAGVVTAWPSAARACPVCWSPNDSALGAFLLTGVIMSVLPLLMIGGIGLWWWRHTRGGPPAPAARRFERRLRPADPVLGEAPKGPVEVPSEHQVGSPGVGPPAPQPLGSAPAEPERSATARFVHGL